MTRRFPELERNDSMLAPMIVEDRIRQMPLYGIAKRSVIRRAVELCDGKSVAEMRELGGFSEVARRMIEELSEAYDVDYGSKMYPRTVKSVLQGDVPQLRESIQARCCTLKAERKSIEA